MTNDRALTAEQFEDLEQEHEASLFGMWVFLGSEILFFIALFAGYTVYRAIYYPAAFAEGSSHTHIMLGTVNTVLLLTSSLTMTLSVRSIKLGKRQLTVGFLLLTALLGIIFLGIKGTEYYKEYTAHLVPGVNFSYEGPAAEQVKLFFCFYFFMTGLHTIHLFIGIGVMIVIAIMAWRRRFSSRYFTPVEMTGLYWHFVDTVWVFLYPLLYLV